MLLNFIGGGVPFSMFALPIGDFKKIIEKSICNAVPNRDILLNHCYYGDTTNTLKQLKNSMFHPLSCVFPGFCKLFRTSEMKNCEEIYIFSFEKKTYTTNMVFAFIRQCRCSKLPQA